MSLLSNYLYDQNIIVQIHDDPRTPRRNRIVYSKPIKIYKGIDNPIVLNFYNPDQKLIPILDKEIRIHIINESDETINLTKLAVVNTLSKGLATTTITSIDLLPFPAGFYHISVEITGENNEKQVVYSDDNYGVGSSLQIIDKMYPRFVSSDELPINSNNVTSSYSLGNTRLTNAPITHTAQFYLNSFTGNIVIQGTLDELPDFNLANWFDIQTETFANSSTNSYSVWTGLYSAIRFNVSGNAGTVSKILYRP